MKAKTKESKPAVKKSLKKQSSIPKKSKILGDFQPSIKIKTATVQKRFDSEVERLRKKNIKNSIGVLSILGSNVYIVNDDITFTKRKVIAEMKNGNLKYMAADKKALEYAVKAYPKTPKIFWLLAIKTLFGENRITPNIERLKNVASLLGMKKDKDVKKLIDKYKKDVDSKFGGEFCFENSELDKDFDGKILVDDGEGGEHIDSDRDLGGGVKSTKKFKVVGLKNRRLTPRVKSVNGFGQEFSVNPMETFAEIKKRNKKK